MPFIPALFATMVVLDPGVHESVRDHVDEAADELGTISSDDPSQAVGLDEA